MSTKDTTNQEVMFVGESKAPAYTTDGESHHFQLDPIRGFPELRWAGKRPFRSIPYYPAQLRESYAGESSKPRNEIFWGDNLQVMSHLLRRYRGKVDLVYIDPPFDSGADYSKKIRLRGKSLTSDASMFEEKQYTDIWVNDEYLQFMYERLVLLRELLSDSGSLYLHCDQRKSAHLRVVMDEVFGPPNFRSQICWKSSPGHSDTAFYGPMQNHILFYTKTKNPIWNQQYQAYDEEYLATHYKKVDENGRRFEDDNLTAYGLSGGGYTYEWNGHTKLWRCPIETMQRLEAEGRIYYTRTGGARYKRFLDEMPGNPLSDLWSDIPRLNSQAKEKVGYPTQKPEALLERIVLASSNPGSIVFDCFMGSGTTQAVALRSGRQFIGSDINLGAVQTSISRLVQIGREIDESPGLDVYSVNNYEVFRNPVQARELLVEALQIQPMLGGGLFDGEKNGRLVKIMPMNRIATRQDLNELITSFNYKLFDKRKHEAPNQPVERLLIVCMGHEPDLKAHLQEQVPYKLDVEVVDILRDRADLEFKRDSEARVRVVDGELVIEAFYPMALLQKLSVMKEDVGEWRELVDSVLVDFNYDGVVMQPAVVDVPGQGDLASGRYPVPEDAGTIRVRITDVLSESWEGEVQDG